MLSLIMLKKLLKEFGCPKIPIYCDERLDDAIKMLDQCMGHNNRKYSIGSTTTGFTIKETKTGQQDWSLLYDSSEQLEDTFFKTLPQSN